jgi:shikimate dehydrogenase
MLAPHSRPDRYAVVGHPVAHSKSPVIHAAFAEATAQHLRYDKLCAPLDGFVPTVHGFIAGGGMGLNVTIPFKIEAFELADLLSDRARAAGAVNTLRFDEQDGGVTIHGDNTDGAGLVNDITRNIGRRIEGTRILLLGAGGAARGTILPLLACGPKHLTIVNRTEARALELEARFAEAAHRHGCDLRAGGNALVAAPDAPYDIVINATSGSLSDAVPVFGAEAIGSNTLAYDMMYGPAPTVFMRHASALGAEVSDGLGMLVEQAAEAFFLWRNVRPDGLPVLRTLREGMSPHTHPFRTHTGAPG